MAKVNSKTSATPVKKARVEKTPAEILVQSASLFVKKNQSFDLDTLLNTVKAIHANPPVTRTKLTEEEKAARTAARKKATLSKRLAKLQEELEKLS
jgi:hypothetical protein